MAAATDTTADAVQAPPPATKPLDRLREGINRLSNQQKIMLMVAIAAMVAVIVGTVMASRQPEYKVLFSNLSEKDGGAIISSLEQLNVPYRFADGSGAILVPSDKVHEARLRLASQGLPKGGLVGFELMENQKFGMSQFAEQVNYQRALEGELARTIQSVATVENARVHLAIPKPSVFVREEQKPTASVMVQLYPGRALEPAQVAGIQHLVASSVPQLPTANVTVIDQQGNLLSQLKSKLIEAGLDPTQLKYVGEVEASVIKRIDDILSPVVGPGNARVQVAADMDFSQNEQTAESYRPNGSPPDVTIRSQQVSETANVNPPAQGVPGALSNQPPVPATAPLTQPNVGATTPAAAPGQPPPPGKVDAAGVTAPIYSAGQPVNTRKDSTINYEVDRTIRHTKGAVGTIRRLSVAVVVNNRGDKDKNGKPIERPLNEQELKQINDLVREAMGYNKDRGDTLSVANSPFNLGEKSTLEIPLWKQPETIEFGKELVKWLAVAGIVLAIILMVVRPALKTMFPPPAEAQDEEEPGMETIEEEDGTIVQVNPFEQKLAEARDLAKENPKAVANIIKDWMGGGA